MPVDIHYGDIKGSAAKIVHKHLALYFACGCIIERRGNGLINNPDDVEAYRSFSQILSLRWRQILLAIEHEIAFEDVRLGSSRYQGVQVSIERGFSL